ncbi:unnamed protein product [Soboliphyme baturini]|uniref:LemA family protein n=1 Tax=Soboliphyme baturini TaxID=241478 RepID=A0A183IW59_9BILA|nr:unnamed protein product [Soboliphyme baturini]
MALQKELNVLAPGLYVQAVRVAQIQYEQRILEKQSMKKMSELEDQTNLARVRSRADASYYEGLKQAEVNKILLTPEFLELRRIDAIAKNNKIYYGERIPSAFLSALSSDKNANGV